MATPVQYSGDLPASAADVFALLCTRDYWEECARAAGSDRATVADFTVTGPQDAPSSVSVTLLQYVLAKDIPESLRTFLKGDLEVRRTVELAAPVDGSGEGPTSATVAHGLGSIRGTVALRDGTGGRSTLSVDGEASVSLPFVGAKVEAILAERLSHVLRAEDAVTARRLAA